MKIFETILKLFPSLTVEKQHHPSFKDISQVRTIPAVGCVLTLEGKIQANFGSCMAAKYH